MANTTGGFDVLNPVPMDNRTFVSTIAGIANINNAHVGMHFFVAETGKDYNVKSLSGGKISQYERSGSVVTLNAADKHWYIDGVDTGVCAEGTKGDTGDKGDDYVLTQADKVEIAALADASRTTKVLTVTYEDGTSETFNVVVI